MRLWLARLICPHDYRVVPYEPTGAMTRAASKALSPGRRPTEEWVSVREKHTIRYQAMLDAIDNGRND